MKVKIKDVKSKPSATDSALMEESKKLQKTKQYQTLSMEDDLLSEREKRQLALKQSAPKATPVRHHEEDFAAKILDSAEKKAAARKAANEFVQETLRLDRIEKEHTFPVPSNWPDPSYITELEHKAKLYNDLLALAEFTEHSGVLQWGKWGFHVQVQEKVAVKSEASDGTALQWQPITGIFATPLEAIQAALTSRTGKGIPEPPEPPQKAPESQIEPSDNRDVPGYDSETGEVLFAEPEPEKEEEVSFDPEKPIVFTANFGNEIDGMSNTARFLINAATRTKLFCTCKSNKTIGGVIFDVTTGLSLEGNTPPQFNIDPEVLKKIVYAVTAKFGPDKEYVKPVVQKQLEPESEPEPEALSEMEQTQVDPYEEMEQRLLPMIGKQVIAIKRYNNPSNDTIIGTYLGRTYHTEDGLMFAVMSDTAKKKRLVAVKPESISSAEDDD